MRSVRIHGVTPSALGEFGECFERAVSQRNGRTATGTVEAVAIVLHETGIAVVRFEEQVEPEGSDGVERFPRASGNGTVKLELSHGSFFDKEWLNEPSRTNRDGGREVEANGIATNDAAVNVELSRREMKSGRQ